MKTKKNLLQHCYISNSLTRKALKFLRLMLLYLNARCTKIIHLTCVIKESWDYLCTCASSFPHPTADRASSGSLAGNWTEVSVIKIHILHPPSHLHSHGTGLQLQPAWDRAGGVSVLWRVGRVNTAHTSVHVWTHVNTYAYTRILMTHTQSPCASPPLPCSSWVKPGPRHFTSGCLQGSEVMCNGPVHLPEQ